MKTSYLRTISQIFFVGLISAFGIRHHIVGGGPTGSPPIDSYCPFGGVETLVHFATTGEFIKKTNYSNLVILAAVIIVAVAAGAAFCSWICPFGAVQEWLGKVGRRLFKRQLALPRRIDVPLRNLRYVVLALIVYMTIRAASLWFAAYDPFKIMFGFEIETTLGWAILAATILVSLVIDRAWCKYLCPLGAVITLVAKVSPLKLQRNADICVDCNLCTRACPVRIDVAHLSVAPQAECVKCLECLEACRKKGALALEVGGGAR